MCADLLEERLTSTFAATAIDDVEASIHHEHHVGQQLWWVLKVRIQHKDPVTLRRF